MVIGLSAPECLGTMTAVGRTRDTWIIDELAMRVIRRRQVDGVKSMAWSAVG